MQDFLYVRILKGIFITLVVFFITTNTLYIIGLGDYNLPEYLVFYIIQKRKDIIQVIRNL